MNDPVVPSTVVDAIRREVGAMVLQTMLKIEGTISDPNMRWKAMRRAVKVLVRKDL